MWHSRLWKNSVTRLPTFSVSMSRNSHRTASTSGLGALSLPTAKSHNTHSTMSTASCGIMSRPNSRAKLTKVIVHSS